MNLRQTLTQKVGPLPVYGWAAGATVLGVGFILWRRRGKAGAAAADPKSAYDDYMKAFNDGVASGGGSAGGFGGGNDYSGGGSSIGGANQKNRGNKPIYGPYVAPPKVSQDMLDKLYADIDWLSPRRASIPTAGEANVKSITESGYGSWTNGQITTGPDWYERANVLPQAYAKANPTQQALMRQQYPDVDFAPEKTSLSRPKSGNDSLALARTDKSLAAKLAKYTGTNVYGT